MGLTETETLFLIPLGLRSNDEGLRMDILE